MEITNFIVEANNKINDYMQKTEKFDTEIDYINKKYNYSDSKYQSQRSIFITYKDKFVEKLKTIRNIDDYTNTKENFYWLTSYFNALSKQFYLYKLEYLAETLSNLIKNGIIYQEQINQLMFHGYKVLYKDNAGNKDVYSFRFCNGLVKYNIYGIEIENELEELTNFLVQFIMNLK